MAVLEVHGLSKIYEGKIATKALDGVTFRIDKGEFVGIMGPSGSGKTTLLNVISTIDEPTSGEVILNGQDPHRLNKEQTALFRRREPGSFFNISTCSTR